MSFGRNDIDDDSWDDGIFAHGGGLKGRSGIHMLRVGACPIGGS